MQLRGITHSENEGHIGLALICDVQLLCLLVGKPFKLNFSSSTLSNEHPQGSAGQKTPAVLLKVNSF